MDTLYILGKVSTPTYLGMEVRIVEQVLLPNVFVWCRRAVESRGLSDRLKT